MPQTKRRRHAGGRGQGPAACRRAAGGEKRGAAAAKQRPLFVFTPIITEAGQKMKPGGRTFCRRCDLEQKAAPAKQWAVRSRRTPLEDRLQGLSPEPRAAAQTPLAALTLQSAGPVKDQIRKNVKAKIKASRRRAQSAGPMRNRTQENDKAKVRPDAAERRPRARREERSFSPGKASGVPPNKKAAAAAAFLLVSRSGPPKAPGLFLTVLRRARRLLTGAARPACAQNGPAAVFQPASPFLRPRVVLSFLRLRSAGMGLGLSSKR